MQIEINERTFIYLLHAMDLYAKHLNADEEDAGPSGEDAMYIWHVRDALKKKYIGEDGKIKTEFLP